MSNTGNLKTDNVVLVFSVIAIVIIGTLSMATITNNNKIEHDQMHNPDKIIEDAANAGIKGAKRHIECHNITSAGKLSSKYYINGAIYDVKWDNVNLDDSTVIIRSRSEYISHINTCYSIELESKEKLVFISSHDQDILDHYYTDQINSTAN